MSEDVLEAHEQTLVELEAVIEEFRTGSITDALEQLEAMRADRAAVLADAAEEDGEGED